MDDTPLVGDDPNPPKDALPIDASEDWVSRLRSGDPAAFEACVHDHQEHLFRLLFRLTGDMDDSLDLVQETFLRAMRGFPTFRGKSSIRTWLHRIAMNVFLNHKRRRQPQVVDLETLENLKPSWWNRWGGRISIPENVVIDREQREQLGRAIFKLPPDYRVVLCLRDREGYTTQEVADLLELSIAAVKSRLYRARLFVRRELLENP